MPKHATKKPWNKGKIIGPKPALTPEQVQAIKIILAQSAPIRDQLLFAVAIDSCLRGSDLVRLMVGDLTLAGQPRDQVRVMPTKTAETTGETIIFELQSPHQGAPGRAHRDQWPRRCGSNFHAASEDHTTPCTHRTRLSEPGEKVGRCDRA